MFLLISGRHVGAHLGGHQHGGSVQISINLVKTFLRISSIRKIAVTWILARVFAYLPSFYFQILDLIYWRVLIFYFDLFWMAWHWKPAITSDSLWKIWLVESIQSIHNSLWTWHDNCNICCRYCIYHVKFNICLVTRPLGVFPSETKWLNASLLFLRLNYVKNVK